MKRFLSRLTRFPRHPRKTASPLRALLPCACILLATATLKAEPRPDAARRESYERGVAAMKSREWQEASRLFQELWQEQKTYDVALMLGQIETNLERFREAAEYLDYGIRNAVPREKLETLARSRKLLEIAKGRVATLSIRVDKAGADIEVDGRLVGRSPFDHDVYAEPGSRLVEATSPDAVVRDTVDVRAGERRVVALEFPEAPESSSMAPDADLVESEGQAPPSSQELPPDSTPKKARALERAEESDAAWPVAAGVAAGVAALTGGAFLLAAAAKDDERKDLVGQLEGRNPCGYGQNDAGTLRDCQRIEELAEEKATFRTLGGASLGVAAACALVTTYLLWPRDEEKRALSFSLVPSPSPAGLSFYTGLSGTFE